jgi:hypothetical protein
MKATGVPFVIPQLPGSLNGSMKIASKESVG